MIKNTIIISLMLFTLSCSDFYKEDLSSIVTLENPTFRTEQGLLATLAGSYQPLSDGFNMGLSSAASKLVLMGSDDLTTHKASSRIYYTEFDMFLISTRNSYVAKVWNGLYKSIQGSNDIIANYTWVEGDPSVINQITGEAYFLRAYCNFWIGRLWGEAPLITGSGYDFYDEDRLPVKNSTISEIYTQIIADLKEAEILLGNKKPQPGRVCKGTAKAVLAEVYLQMAGWPLNETSYYALAAEKAKEVIDNEETYGLGLIDDFAKLWPNEEHNFDGNKEEVFALNFSGIGSQYNCVYGISSKPGAEEKGWDDYFVEITFFNEFPAGYRKNVTFLTEVYSEKNDKMIPWQNFGTRHPYYKKFKATGNTSRNLVSLPLERMAEVYINYAEARVMETGNTTDAEALEAIKMIVRRGAGLPFDTPAPGVDWTVATQDMIAEEKAWEFAGEFCRWFDLVRLQKLEEVVAKQDYWDLHPLGPLKYFLPIPYDM